jgi:hypothetical protein
MTIRRLEILEMGKLKSYLNQQERILVSHPDFPYPNLWLIGEISEKCPQAEFKGLKVLEGWIPGRFSLAVNYLSPSEELGESNCQPRDRPYN